MLPFRLHYCGILNDTVRGYCLDIPRFEESLNNKSEHLKL